MLVRGRANIGRPDHILQHRVRVLARGVHSDVEHEEEGLAGVPHSTRLDVALPVGAIGPCRARAWH